MKFRHFCTTYIINVAHNKESHLGITIVTSLSESMGNSIVHFVHAQVSDIAYMIQEINASIMNTSWLSKLEPLPKRSYEKRAQLTINYIVNNILAKVMDSVTEDLGELVVSIKGQDLLQSQHSHTKLPLAELWKEQVRGNPGFDFHTESPSNLVTFGEAKYNSRQNAYGTAINQINRFIELEKDVQEMSDLEKFITEQAKVNFNLPTGKAFAAAFSIHSKDSEKIFANIKQHDGFKQLLHYPEVYLLGIEIVS